MLSLRWKLNSVIVYLCRKNIFYAPVAQLDRAFDYGSKGLRFESLRVYKIIPILKVGIFCFKTFQNSLISLR